MVFPVKGHKDGKILTVQFNGKETQNLKKAEKINSLVLLSMVGNEHCQNDFLGVMIKTALNDPGLKAIPEKQNINRGTQKGKPSEKSLDANSKTSEERKKGNFTTFLVADQVYWHNLKKIQVTEEEERLKREAKKEFGIEAEQLTLDAQAKIISHRLASINIPFEQFILLYPEVDQENTSFYRKIALINQFAEKITLKEEAIRLGDKYLTDNLQQFLLPFNLALEDFDYLYQHIQKTSELGEQVSDQLFSHLGLDQEDYKKLWIAAEEQTTPIDKKIAIINQMAQCKEMNFNIIRWRDWVNSDAKFVEKQQSLTEYYFQNPILEKSIEITADDFARRHEAEEGYDLAHFRSLGYLSEESPAIIWLGAKKGINRIIYPGEILPCFITSKEVFIVGQESEEKDFKIRVDDPKLLTIWVEARFKREFSRQQKQAMIEKEPDTPQPPNRFSFFSPARLDKIKSGNPAAESLREEAREITHDALKISSSKNNPSSDEIERSVATILSLSPETKARLLGHLMETLNSSVRLQEEEIESTSLFKLGPTLS